MAEGNLPKNRFFKVHVIIAAQKHLASRAIYMIENLVKLIVRF